MPPFNQNSPAISYTAMLPWLEESFNNDLSTPPIC